MRKALSVSDLREQVKLFKIIVVVNAALLGLARSSCFGLGRPGRFGPGIVFIRPDESDGLDGVRRAGGPWGRRARSGLSCESTRTTSRSPSRTSCSGSRKSNGNIRTSTCSSTAMSTRFARGRRRKLGQSPRRSKAARRRRRPKPFGGAPPSAAHGGQEATGGGSHLRPDRTFGPREDGDDRGPRRRL